MAHPLWARRGPLRGAVEAPHDSELPLPSAKLGYRPPSGRAEQQGSFSVSLRFRIHASGLSLGIEAGQGAEGAYSANASDLVPAFATRRFKAGTKRRDCEIQFVPQSRPVHEADRADVNRYMALARPRQAGWNSKIAV